MTCMNPAISNRPGPSRGSILIYVLWILVIVSVLAWQLASSSRATVLDRKAASAAMERELQLLSVQRFAEFRILSGEWKHEKYEFVLNEEPVSIKIINESGYISLSDLRNKSLKKALQIVNLDPQLLEKLKKNDEDDENTVPVADPWQLARLLGLNEVQVWQLLERISLLHQGPANLDEAPDAVLAVMHRVDQYRVEQMLQAENEEERNRLRSEIVDQLMNQGEETSEEMSAYYRVLAQIGERQYRIQMRYDRDEDRFKVVSTRLRPVDLQTTERDEPAGG